MKNLVFIALTFLFAMPISGQDALNRNEVSDTITPLPSVVIVQDERIETLMSKKIFIATLSSKVKDKAGEDKRVRVDKFGRVNIPGFRIQLLNSTDRAAVYDMKGKLFQIYPNVRQYVIAQAPFYKLRFGNFKTKEEAERYKKALLPMFPGGIYIVNDIIEAQLDPKTKDVPLDELNTKKPATKAQAKPSAKPATKPTGKPVAKPAVKPAVKPTTKPKA